MTLLRRAPREVYRLYSEDEFLGGAVVDRRLDAPTAGGEHRLRRVAGATMLLAAVGAVGGLVALSESSPATRSGRRAGAGLLALAGSLGSSRAAPARPARVPPRPPAVRRSRTGARLDVSAPRPATAPASSDVTTPAISEHMIASASPGPGAALGQPHPRQSEFGFER
jgi:hypothetical protein